MAVNRNFGMVARWGAADALGMAAENPINVRFEQLTRKYGLSLNALAKEGRIATGTLQYYWGPKGTFKGRHLPAEKPWAPVVRRILMDRGMTPSEAAELFGLQAQADAAEIKELRELLRSQNQTQVRLVDAVEMLTDEVRKLRNRLPD